MTTRPPVRPERDLEEAFDRLVEEGANRLARPWLPLLATGTLGGIDVGTGVLAYLVVYRETHNGPLAGLAFSIGFIALLLARSELFTENFLVPVVTLVAGHGNGWELLRLWGTALVTNLFGGWVMTWLIIEGLPELRPTARAVGEHYAKLGVNLRSFALAVLAGAVITLMTRMQHATESLGVRMVPAVLFGALLVGAGLFHCILDSLFMFCGLWSHAAYGYADWLVGLGWSAFGNLIGGLVLVTFIRLLQIPHRVAEARAGGGAND
jgi:formate/nitrite transporter FocA (FNT family)